jgi:hypothetical protein
MKTCRAGLHQYEPNGTGCAERRTERGRASAGKRREARATKRAAKGLPPVNRGRPPRQPEASKSFAYDVRQCSTCGREWQYARIAGVGISATTYDKAGVMPCCA